MTNKQILKKAIDKAVKNGWVTDVLDINEGYENIVVFSHDFAKAIWGNKPIEFITVHSKSGKGGIVLTFREPGTIIPNSAWQFHLQQMVLQEDPLKYLEQFIK